MLMKYLLGFGTLAIIFDQTYGVQIKFRPLPGTAPWDKPSSNSTWADPKDYKIDYFVPDFGMDTEIQSSLSNTKEAEKKWGKKFETNIFKKIKGPPKDYFVPNFGLDQDIIDSQQNLKDQEKIYGEWKLKKDDFGQYEGIPVAASGDSYAYAV